MEEELCLGDILSCKWGTIRAPHHMESGWLVRAEVQDVQKRVAEDSQGCQLDHVDVEGLFNQNKVVGCHEEAVEV